jgi:two-component system OmpR family response regulator
MSRKILIIEDDVPTAAYIAAALQEQGMATDHAATGRDGVFHAMDATYDCIVLDRMLPGMNGMSVLGAIRGAGIATPVIILSAMGSAEDRIGGLEGGADDYLVKPFALGELLARIKLLLRHAEGQRGAPETKLVSADLEMDLLAHVVRRAGRIIDLQPREYRLLEYMLRHAGQVVTRTMLLEGVWDYHFDPGTNVIDVHISRLRKKIDVSGLPPLLYTVRGSGYRLGTEG